MWSYLLSVNACRGFIGLIGAIFVIIGVIKTDSDYDNFGKTDSPYGAFFFFSGWLLFAASIGFINQSAAGFVFSWKALFGFVGSALVIVAASLSQVVMYKKDVKMMRAHLIFFIISWIFTAYAIAMPAYAFLPIHYKRFFIALLGAFGVIYGMLLQMQYRKRGLKFIETGQPSPGNSYSPGLPFFTAGWLFLALANALM